MIGRVFTDGLILETLVMYTDGLFSYCLDLSDGSLFAYNYTEEELLEDVLGDTEHWALLVRGLLGLVDVETVKGNDGYYEWIEANA